MHVRMLMPPTSRYDMMRTLLVDKQLVGRFIRPECAPSDPCMRSMVVASDLRDQSKRQL